MNYLVKKYGDKHICLECRKRLVSPSNDPVMVLQDEKGRVCCVGYKFEEKRGIR